MEHQYKVFNAAGIVVGTVPAKSVDHARVRAVQRALVAGKKQIGKIELITMDDPYEQSWSDIYG